MAKNKTIQKNWTTEEDEFLKESHKKLRTQEIADKLNRSASSITSRIYTLKLNDSKGDQPSREKDITEILAGLKRIKYEKNKELETVEEKITAIEKALKIVQIENLA